MESTTVTLGGRLVQLQPPPFDHRADIALTLAEAQGRGDNLAAYARIGWAALGLCLPESCQPKARYAGNPERLGAYAATVYRELRGRGWTHNEIQAACRDACNAIVDDVLLPSAEASTREDFSGALGGPTTS